jgi:hypothetical protein
MKTIGNGYSLALPILRLRYHQSIKNLALLFSLALMGLIILSGCADRRARPVIHTTEIPTYAQDHPVTIFKTLQIQIDKTYWTDRFEKPGYSSIANLPPQYRKQREAALVATPSAKFLVVEFTVSNLGRTAAMWDKSKPPLFMLVNAEGLKYASADQQINKDDLTAKIILGQSNMNPGMSIKGKKVFDIPQGEYLMHVSLGRHAGGWSFTEGSTLFKWILNPSGK